MQCWYDTKSFLHFLLIFKKNKLSWNTSPVFENIYTSLYEWASLIYWGMDIAKHSRHNYVSQLASFIDRLSGFIWQFMLFNWQFMRSVSASIFKSSVMNFFNWCWKLLEVGEHKLLFLPGAEMHMAKYLFILLLYEYLKWRILPIIQPWRFPAVP